jgi:phage host-nuclease inhibitor protein Gam
MVLPLFLSGCMGLDKKTTTTTTPTPTSTTAVTALQDRTTALESRITALEGKVSNLSNNEVEIEQLQADMASIQAELANYSSTELANLQAQIDILTDQIDELTENSSSSSSTITTDVVRWRFDTPAIYQYPSNAPIAGLDTYIYTDTTIKDEDIYFVTIVVKNDTGATIPLGACYFDVVLRPRTSTDYALLDESTFMDTDDRPYRWLGTDSSFLPELSWDADFYTRTVLSKDVTRRVTFTSSRWNITTGLDDGEEIVIPLALELYYAD